MPKTYKEKIASARDDLEKLKFSRNVIVYEHLKKIGLLDKLIKSQNKLDKLLKNCEHQWKVKETGNTDDQYSCCDYEIFHEKICSICGVKQNFTTIATRTR